MNPANVGETSASRYKSGFRPEVRSRSDCISLSTLAFMTILVAACDSSSVIPPGIETLSVSVGNESMFPSYNADTRQYAVRCGVSEVFRISLKAAGPNQVISVNGFVGAVGKLETQFQTPTDDQDYVFKVSRGGDSESYTVHCIPANTPDIEISFSNSGASQDPLYLTPQFTEAGERKTYLMIVDNNGVPLFQRLIDGRAADFKRHENGRYTYALGIGRNQFGLRDSVIVVLDEALQEIDRLSTVNLTQTDSHDFLFTEEGNRLFISYNSVVRDMTAFGLSAQETVGDSVIQELDADGNIVFQWSSWDHIDLQDCEQTDYPRFPSDYGHINAISLTEDGDIIGSFRGCAQVLKIDRPTGSVEWFLGGSKSDYLIVGDPFNEFCGQHTAWGLDNGNILLFDNGNFCLGDRESSFGQFSRAVEYSLDITAGQASLVRDYSLDGTYLEFTRSQGSVQPLSNGNWLIGWGSGPGTSVTEVNQAGEKVFELRLSVAGDVSVSYRAFRFPFPTAD